MLIVSNFHDYYDSALGVTGVDKTCVFKRSTKEVKVFQPAARRKCGERNEEESLLVSGDAYYKEPYLQSKLVGFCGEIYPAVEIRPNGRLLEPVESIYDEESAIEALRRIRGCLLKQNYSLPWNRWTLGWVKRFFSYDWRQFKGLFLEHKVPSFLILGSTYRGKHDHVVILNPELKKHGFVRVKDPFTAFQDIHMFLSGCLGSEGKHMVEVGNDDRIEARGFDKWSFRKEPRKRKAKEQ